MPEEPCLRLEAGSCSAPCSGLITTGAYRRIVTSASRFLRRPPRAFVQALREQMHSAADRHDYERARELRDRLVALEHAASPQVAERSRTRNVDILFAEDGSALAMFVHRGVIVGLGPLTAIDESRAGLQAFLRAAHRTAPPDQLVTNPAIDWRGLNTVAPIIVPRTAASYAGRLLEICRINHRYRLQMQVESSELDQGSNEART